MGRFKDIDRETYLKTMRQVVAGVTVITVSGKNGLHAMTATAFLPVSLDPPLILVSVDRGNDTHELLENTRRFGVTLLGQGQEYISIRFAGKGPDRVNFDDLPCVTGPGGSTFFEGYAGAIEASISRRLRGGDHTLFLARVLWMDVCPETRPLVYHQGRYHQLAPLNESVKEAAR